MIIDPKNFTSNDIAFFINKHLQPSEINDILTNLWKPDPTFVFPISKNYDKSKKGQTIKFQYNWLLRWSWLAYSNKEDGAFCKVCVAFSKCGAGVNNQNLGALTKRKFDNWKHATEIFKKHALLQYHLKSIMDADNFIKTKNNPSEVIINILDSTRAKQVMENRKNIKPIIEAISMCGKQDLALRGHRDSGRLVVEKSESTNEANEGNFRELLRYRALGDMHLKNVLEGPGLRNKYISSISQNAIIDSFNNVLLRKIVSRVNKAKCFTILADETADISGIEQVSLCARYVDLEKMIIREDFLQFVPTYDLTGKALAKLILDNLNQFGIETAFLRGQGYDGAATMSGKYNGVKAHINQSHPLAMFVHCAAHSFNLVVSKSCSIQSIRNCLGTVGKTHDFFVYPKRKHVLAEYIDSSAQEIHVKSLKRSCATRWIERFHSIHDFIELIDCVIESLEIISLWDNIETSSQANNLKNAILQSDFLVSLLVVSKIFALGLQLSKSFQNTNIDLRKAVTLAEDTLKELEHLRNTAENEFKNIFHDVSILAKKLDVQIVVPRLTKHQQNRINIQSHTPEDYYRISIFIPFLDIFISEIKCRFIEHKTTLSGFSSLFSEITTSSTEDFYKLVHHYGIDLIDHNKDILISELKLWIRKINSLTMKPKNAMEALSICTDMYPNIFKLLQILATLPVSIATAERSFSTLKRIKTYPRNSISEVNRVVINPNNIIYICNLYL